MAECTEKLSVSAVYSQCSDPALLIPAAIKHCNKRARTMQFNKKQDKPQQDGTMNRKLKESDSNAHHDFAYTMFAATRSIRRSLIKFIRMTDYMLGSALRSVLMSSCEAVIDTLVTRNCLPALTEAVRCCRLPSCMLNYSVARCSWWDHLCTKRVWFKQFYLEDG